jgi:hypothetical protein
MRKQLSVGVAVLLVSIGLGTTGIAHATENDSSPEICEVIEHPAVTHEVQHPAETHEVQHPAVTEEVKVVDQEAVAGVWANWAPDNTQGPQDYVPIWPSDDRGKWIVHDQGVPPGHEGPDGVYQQGGGNSPFFYRQAAVDEVFHYETVVVKEAWTEIVVDKEAWTEEIPCEEEPPLTCEDDPTLEGCGEEPPVTECPEDARPIADFCGEIGDPKGPVITPVPNDPKEPAVPVTTTVVPNKPANPPVQKQIQVPTAVDAGI